jgi:uncharacterized protein (TIGR00255 family)
MTGFGAADGLAGSSRVSVEVRTVNHRFFSPSLKIPAAYGRWEGEVRELLRQRIARGHVTLTVRVERDASAAATVIDETRFAEYLAALRALQKKHSLEGTIDIATVLRLPDVVAAQTEVVEPDAGEVLAGIVSNAVDALVKMRQAEGAQLAAFLLERVDIIEAALGRVEERAPIRLKEQHERIRRAVGDLIGAAGADPQRVAQEIAILADRLDVSEELDRFRSHLSAFRETTRAKSNEPVGKRLGFILQEMVREANTVGSKASDAAILNEVIAIKEELERIREQVENLE